MKLSFVQMNVQEIEHCTRIAGGSAAMLEFWTLLYIPTWLGSDWLTCVTCPCNKHVKESYPAPNWHFFSLWVLSLFNLIFSTSYVGWFHLRVINNNTPNTGVYSLYCNQRLSTTLLLTNRIGEVGVACIYLPSAVCIMRQ